MEAKVIFIPIEDASPLVTKCTPSAVHIRPTIKGLFTLRYEFILSAIQGKLLYEPPVRLCHKSKVIEDGGCIYLGTLPFPDQCCVCMGDTEKHDIAELELLKDHYGSAASGSSRLMMISRYWYSIPFCSQHGLAQHPIHLAQAKDLSIHIGFVCREYGEAFGELNQISGEWRRGLR
jgi:hypothetical protein